MLKDPVYAAAPFDHEKADIILRASDNTDFRVFKLFLSLASPFFETLFDIPQPTEESQEVRDGLVVIPVTEGSKTLKNLLRFCYPCTLADDPTLEVLKDAMDVLEAARKYSLDAIEIKARRAVVNPKILEAEPLRCYMVAHKGRLRDETLLTARYTLTQPLIPLWFEEIDLLSGTDFLSLLTYHKKCAEAVYALKFDLSWIKSHYGSSHGASWLSGRVNWGSHSQRNCECPRPEPSRYMIFEAPPRWWEDFMEEVFMALRDKPCKNTVQVCADKTVQTVKAKNCQACSSKVAKGMHNFVDLFGRKIEETVSQITLELSF